MIVNRMKKYKIRPNKRNKSCKNIQIHNENITYYDDQYIIYGDQDITNEEPIVYNENECFFCLEVYLDKL